MFITQVISKKRDLFLGISEVKNEQGLSKDALISRATCSNEGIRAVQLLDGTMIVDTHHLISAVQNAVNSWENDYTQSRSLDIEIAVYASGQKQIGRALDTFGVKDGLERIAVVTVGVTKEQVSTCLQLLSDAIGKTYDIPFPVDSKRFSKISRYFGIESEELSTFVTSDDPAEYQRALSRCVASRVSLVALES